MTIQRFFEPIIEQYNIKAVCEYMGITENLKTLIFKPIDLPSNDIKNLEYL